MRFFRGATVLVVGLLVLVAGRVESAERFLTEDAAVARILDLADQRLALMPGVAAAKWRTHAPILDSERERVVIQHAGELAGPLGLAARPVEGVFEIQVRLAREWELHLTEDWAAHGFRFAAPIPDLGRQIRPQLDEVTTQMLRALYLAAPVLRRPEFIKHYARLAAGRLHGEGWSNESRRELLAALAGVRAVASPALQRIAASGVLRVAVTGDYAPFSIEADGAVSGADIEMARKLAQSLHAEPIFIRTKWKSLLQDLSQDKFDVVMGGVSVTPERQAQGEFSVAYAAGGKTIIARCVDKGRYHDLASVDRKTVRVIVNPGGTNEQYVRTNVHQAHVRVYPDNRTIFEQIRAGRADVMITDDAEVDLQTQRHPDLCRVYEGTLTHADKAILMPRDPPFVGAVNQWLQREIKTGEPARLIRERGQ